METLSLITFEVL